MKAQQAAGWDVRLKGAEFKLDVVRGMVTVVPEEINVLHCFTETQQMITGQAYRQLPVRP